MWSQYANHEETCVPQETVALVPFMLSCSDGCCVCASCGRAADTRCHGSACALFSAVCGSMADLVAVVTFSREGATSTDGW